MTGMNSFVRRALVIDGKDAIAYLEGEGEFNDRSKFPLPAAILLDLNMPRMTGYEVLEWFRSNPEFHQFITAWLID